MVLFPPTVTQLIHTTVFILRVVGTRGLGLAPLGRWVYVQYSVHYF